MIDLENIKQYEIGKRLSFSKYVEFVRIDKYGLIRDYIDAKTYKKEIASELVMFDHNKYSNMYRYNMSARNVRLDCPDRNKYCIDIYVLTGGKTINETVEFYRQLVQRFYYYEDGLLGMISYNSIVGNAYVNAIRRKSEYDDEGQITYLVDPELDDIIYELEKLMVKYRNSGFGISMSAAGLIYVAESKSYQKFKKTMPRIRGRY